MASGNMKVIKRRIKSVESTMQITKAMELVASSKLRKAKEKADNARPYFNALYDTMCEIQAENEGFLSPFTKRSKLGRTLLIVIAGDRGLAGGFNANIFRLAESRIEELGGRENVEVLAVGKKSVEYFDKRGYNMTGRFPNVAEELNIYEASGIANSVIDPFLKGDIKSAELFYTEYVSPIAQVAKNMKILPVEVRKAEKASGPRALPIYEPSASAVFNSIVPGYITGVLFCSIVDSFASEQASRRSAMENASDNAEEMISDLSLMYNRARQASITQEITEIVGGSAGGE